MNQSDIISATRHWVDTVVVGLNFCPFAKRELVKDSVRFTVCEATNEVELLQCLQQELQRMDDEPDLETTLLIHPHALDDFMRYNEFLEQANGLLAVLEREGVYQVASFHPHYQFAGTGLDDAENYTNRSPYPMLHLLREASLEVAIDHYPNVDDIPERNIELTQKLGVQKMRALLASCLENPS
ncbi:DUF1415 domain-containing protein [Marinobacter sp. LV10MA510-1]|uniref:DUF1415 domain-containing protein n=1 Tax=Marinobacter sp. LV10MA510-1 TaxID=1415567 RepID=UPI000BF5F6D5|nr:DUF1415 domain-containing protein [Marinobacter sp. LV10MA510-1]PFG09640.1 hypothetical protein ATI45_2024 [Marinobacter sp. LV10MA510-1]